MAICLPQKFKINIIYIIFRTYKYACSVRNKESITNHEEPASDSSVQPRCTLAVDLRHDCQCETVSI